MAGALAAGGLLAACGGDDDEETQPASPPPAETGSTSAGGAATTTATAGGVEEAIATIEQYRAPIEWKPPRGGEPFDGAAAKGQTLLYLPSSTDAPIIQEIIKGMKEAASTVGVEVISFNAHGRPTEIARGIEQAIGRKVNAIETVAFDITLVEEPLRRAHEAGIKILVNDTNPEFNEQPLPDITDGLISLPWELAADAPGAVDTGDSVMAEFARLAPNLDVRRIGTTFPEWAKLDVRTRNELTNDPDLNYIVPLFDSMTLIMAPAIQAAGFEGKVKLATFNGTEPAVKLIKDGDIVACDAGNSSIVAAWADFDASLRVMLDAPMVVNEDVQLRVFDDTNIDEIDFTKSGDTWYGPTFAEDFRNGYKQLWGVA
jgi:ribose transport system substrate-binding protein